jgi:hypothetical protein
MAKINRPPPATVGVKLCTLLRKASTSEEEDVPRATSLEPVLDGVFGSLIDPLRDDIQTMRNFMLL